MKQQILVTREVFDIVPDYLEGYFMVDSNPSDNPVDVAISAACLRLRHPGDLP